jgi:hypothetical protein
MSCGAARSAFLRSSDRWKAGKPSPDEGRRLSAGST